MSTPIVLPPPTNSPEPPGLMQAIREKVFGRAPAPGTTPQTPDAYALLQNEKAAIELLTKTREICEPGRELFEYGWWRNLLYLLGRQWIYWNPGSREFKDKRLYKWVPKPVTNMIRTTVLSIRATASDLALAAHARPNGQAPKNVMAAQIADDMEPAIQHEHEIKKGFDIADFWTIVTGNSFLHPHWDKADPKNSVQVIREQCMLCQTVSDAVQIQEANGRCPSCGGSQFTQLPPEPVPIGRGRTIVASPLELLMPLYAADFDAVDRLVYLTWKPKHQIEDEFGAEFADRVCADSGPDVRSMQLFKALATTSDLVSTPTSWNTGTFTGYIVGAMEQHLWIRPNRKYPQGVYLRFIGGTNPTPVGLERKPDIPWKTKDNRAIWPWIHYPYEVIGGRLYAMGAIDAIVQKQDQINQTDSLNQLTMQRMGNPIWLEPKGAEVERFTGEPGMVVKYLTVGASGAKPERISGENIPQSFFAVREQYIRDVEELAGTYDVLKGSKPSGVEAFSALQLLVDRSQSRFKTFFKARSEAYRQWYAIALELERMHGPTERVHATLGPNRSWTFQTFDRANLDGDISIVVEDGTNVPKTALGRRAAIEHANQMGMIPKNNPEVQFAVLTEIGVPELVPSLDADVKECQREQQVFEEWAAAGFNGPMPLRRLPWHNDVVHLAENRKWMNGDAVREILQKLGETDPQGAMTIEMALGQHLQEHQQFAMQQAAADQAMSGQGGQPPGDEPGGGGEGGRGAGRAARDSNAQGGSPAGA